MKWDVEPTTCQGKVTGHIVIVKEADEHFPDADITIEVHNAAPELTLDLANHICNLLNFDFAIGATRDALGTDAA